MQRCGQIFRYAIATGARRGTLRPTCGAPWRRWWWKTAQRLQSRRRSAPSSAPSTTT
ncbi:MAG: hypothetical protein ACREUG_16750 [Steroidobacteraceae bacterium]